MPGRSSTPGALHLRRGADDDRHVDQLVGTGLEQQRDLEHGHLGAALRLARAGTSARPRAPGDARSPPARRSVRARPAAPRELVRDRRRRASSCRETPPRSGPPRSTVVEAVHLRIGIEHRNAARAQTRRRGRLAHADRAGETDDQHVRPSMSATMNVAQLRRHLGTHAEPLLEARHRLMQQHAEAVDGASPRARAPAPATPSPAARRRCRRRRSPRRSRAKSISSVPAPFMPSGCRVDEDAGFARAVAAIGPVERLDARPELPRPAARRAPACG